MMINIRDANRNVKYNDKYSRCVNSNVIEKFDYVGKRFLFLIFIDLTR